MNIVDDTAFGAGATGSTARRGARRRARAGREGAAQGAGRAEAAGVIASTALVRGGRDSLQQLVARQADESGADLIVLGTHASRSLSRLFMSQDLGHLHNLVSVPILLVRGEGSHDDVSVIEVAMSEPDAVRRVLIRLSAAAGRAEKAAKRPAFRRLRNALAGRPWPELTGAAP